MSADDNSESRVCLECGKTFSEKEMIKVGRKMYCKECAEHILNEKENSNNSEKIQIINQQSQVSESKKSSEEVVKNHKVAVLLSILLGWIGADRFYVGHIGIGLLKFFTMGAYGLWWIIDIILFVTKNVSGVEWE